jgi:hypothetical protein
MIRPALDRICMRFVKECSGGPTGAAGRELVSLSIQRGDDRVEAQEVADQRQMFAVPREFRLRECTDHDGAEFGDVAHVNDAPLGIERQRPTHVPIRRVLINLAPRGPLDQARVSEGQHWVGRHASAHGRERHRFRLFGRPKCR